MFHVDKRNHVLIKHRLSEPLMFRKGALQVWCFLKTHTLFLKGIQATANGWTEVTSGREKDRALTDRPKVRERETGERQTEREKEIERKRERKRKREKERERSKQRMKARRRGQERE